MKFIISILIIIFPLLLTAQEYRGAEASQYVKGASRVVFSDGGVVPSFVEFASGQEIETENFPEWFQSNISRQVTSGLVLISSETDRLGWTHNRYRQTWNGVPVEHGTLITHSVGKNVVRWNGHFEPIGSAEPETGSYAESLALEAALQFVGAVEYRWENEAWESHLQMLNNDISATWYPEGERLLVNASGRWVEVWRFDIYAQKPFSRQYVYVSTSDGRIVKSENRIRNTDVPGTAVTKYSGTQTITVDQQSPTQYRLRETGRGLGVETYDLNNGSDPGVAVDFTDSDNIWNNVNTNQDEVATDAHWGAEMVYDYYYLRYGRNSLDNAGKKLISYVHFDVNWINAMWDGSSMYYGDGDLGQGVTPLTTIDICAHEVTHGLTQYTANLIYQEEPGALNEAFSDIFGASIRYYAKSWDFSWQIGDEMGWVIRDMSDPNAYGQPDTYLGSQWDPWQEVHTNSGVGNYWFYLLSAGGSGTNDNGDSYNVSGISIDSAAAIAYRLLTVYLTETSEYADARFYSIIAASDLFGECSPEVVQTTNAWYAVGVGLPFNPVVTADFASADSIGCSTPHTVAFDNFSTTASSFQWTFGDGGSSTDIFPTHTYNSLGYFTVRLIADGGACGKDTVEKVAYIDIHSDNPCVVTLPSSGTAPSQTSCNGTLVDAGGDNNYPDNSMSTILISPSGASQLVLVFSEFSLEQDYDYLYIFNGTGTGAPLIGAFTGSSLPNGGTITSSGPALTLRFTSDSYINDTGFRLTWTCITGNEEIDESSISLFPNPANHFVTVQVGKDISESANYRIVSITGQELAAGSCVIQNGKTLIDVDLIGAGSYFLLIQSATKQVQLPFVKCD